MFLCFPFLCDFQSRSWGPRKSWDFFQLRIRSCVITALSFVNVPQVTRRLLLLKDLLTCTTRGKGPAFRVTISQSVDTSSREAHSAVCRGRAGTSQGLELRLSSQAAQHSQEPGGMADGSLVRETSTGRSCPAKLTCSPNQDLPQDESLGCLGPD